MTTGSTPPAPYASSACSSGDDLHFLWLPLSHSFGKLLEVVMIGLGVPTAIDGRLDRIADNLGTLQPTFMAAAPRIFEKIHNTVTVHRSGVRAASS